MPVELGLRVAVVESPEGFILHHQVMEKQTDDQIAVSIVKETQKLFPSFKACSFDKGFHSPANQTGLKVLLDPVTLPEKGKWSASDEAHETSEAFVVARKAHSAVESGINALEVHGPDKCLACPASAASSATWPWPCYRATSKSSARSSAMPNASVWPGNANRNGTGSASKSSPPGFINRVCGHDRQAAPGTLRACHCRVNDALFSG